MITAVRVEGYGESPAELQAELDAILGHFCMAGYLEGIVPQVHTVADEVYPRCRGEVEIAGRKFAFTFEGRKVLHFEPNEFWDVQRPVTQPGYRVVDRGFDPVPAEVQFTGDITSAQGMATLSDPIYRDVTPEVIVLHRALPMDWPDSVRPGPRLERTVKKIGPYDLQEFTEVALRAEVEEASYEIGDSGYTVTVSCVVPADQGGVNAMGWRSHFWAETLADAAIAAGKDIDARVAGMNDVPGAVTGTVGPLQ